MIRWCTVPEIWCTTEGRMEKVTYRGGCIKKTSNKVNALSRVTPLMSFPKKKRIFMNLFLKLQSNYCPLLRMFHIHSLNSKINHLHER